MGWSRFAIYWAPAGTLGDLGARWLGWDMRRSVSIRGPVVDAPGPRRYGFHATLKPPFRLAPRCGELDLVAAARHLFESLPTADLGCLEVTTLGNFCALRPTRRNGIAELADAAVRELDRFRAPMSERERDRRRGPGLTAMQADLLERWGYPYVFQEFQPHLTLSPSAPSNHLVETARGHFAPVLGREVILDRVALVGEDASGYFHLIEEIALAHGAGTSAASDESAASIAN